MKACWKVLLAQCMAVGQILAINNGLGRTPPMGWRSWNLYGANVNQTLIEKMMDGLVSKKREVDGQLTSLCQLGYCDVGLDDNWQDCQAGEEGYRYHDEKGRSVVNLQRFPNMSGMTAHAHELKLTAGWYMNNCICAEKKPATLDMYINDVKSLIDFDFDGVKLDGCGSQRDLDLWAAIMGYMRPKRGVMIENCHWGGTVPEDGWCPWNFFRTSGDVRADYGSIVNNLQTTIQWAQKNLSRPGCWAYPDMLEVGVQHGAGLTYAEQRAHFGAWCIVSSPLTLSMDLYNDKMMDSVWPIIANKEAIAVNQAWDGHSGSPFKCANTTVTFDAEEEGIVAGEEFTGKAATPRLSVPAWQYFYKPVGEGKVAVLMMNHGTDKASFKLDFADVPGISCSTCMVRDLWEHKDLGSQQGSWAAELDSHDSAFLILSPAQEDIGNKFYA